MGIGNWTKCEDGMPEDFVPVICEYNGFWPGWSNGGIIDLYTYKGEWFNVPDSVTITRWMYMPDWLPEDIERTPWKERLQYRRI